MRLYVSSAEAKKVKQLIQPYLVESMKYKLPCPCNDSSARMDGSSKNESHKTPAPISVGVEI